jgi:hypothetical protein
MDLPSALLEKGEHILAFLFLFTLLLCSTSRCRIDWVLQAGYGAMTNLLFGKVPSFGSLGACLVLSLWFSFSGLIFSRYLSGVII